MKIKTIKYGLIGVFLTGKVLASNFGVYNYLSGENPDLTITLSAAGASNSNGLIGVPIEFGVAGLIPCSDNVNDRWSNWDVKDSNGVDYGTITLSTDAACTTVIYNPNGCPNNPNNSCYINNSGNGAALRGILIYDKSYLMVREIIKPKSV